jgi:hypothetical protein
MVGYFPRHSIAWKIDEPAAFRALTLSLFGSGLLAGVVLHLVHTVAFAYIPEGRFVVFSIVDVVILLALLAAAAAHLANYPLRHWIWRAPSFATVAAIGTIATSAVLLALHRERVGSTRANWYAWPSLALRVFVVDLISVCLFAVLLAGVVQVVRSALIRHDHRESTIEAIHEGRVG